MSSTSSTSISRALLILVLCAGVAHAGGRKRIVVLDFEGPKAEKFHDDVVKLIKKQHTVVPSEKWNSTADELDAGTVTEKNIKKVAKKLKVDGVVTGKIEKRRDEYIVHLKLRAGKSGEMAGNAVDTKSDSGRLDGKAQRDVKDELMTSIDDLETNHGGGGGDDDEADKPSKKKKEVAKKDDDDDDAKPAKKAKKGGDDESDDADAATTKKGFSNKKFDRGADSDDDAKPAKKETKKKAAADDDEADAKPAKKDKKAKKTDDDDAAALATKKDDDDSSAKSKKRAAKSDDDDDSAPKKKKVAKKDDDSGGDEEATAEADTDAGVDLEDALSPGGRALDLGVGMSFTARRLTFDAKSYLTGSQIPPNYGQTVPVAGAVFDATVYPLSWGHKRHDALAGLGAELLYDKVLFINSKKLYGMTGMQQVATLDTSESRFGLAAVFRYPMGKLVVGGKLGYESQSFKVAQTTPDNKSTDIPNVEYSIIEPAAFVRYGVIPKLTIGGDVGFLVVTGAGTAAGPIAGTGDIGNSSVYGQATASGYELEANGEYMLTSRIFARAVVRLESISFTFKSDPSGTSLTNTRDTDPTTQDVNGAKDLYFGGYAMVGFLY